MDLKLAALQERIEYLRSKLNTLLTQKIPTDKSVVECSQRLDKLLVEYEKTKVPSEVS